MKVSIAGSGYMGIVTGIGFAELGNKAIFVDIDDWRIDPILLTMENHLFTKRN